MPQRAPTTSPVTTQIRQTDPHRSQPPDHPKYLRCLRRKCPCLLPDCRRRPSSLRSFRGARARSCRDCWRRPEGRRDAGSRRWGPRGSSSPTRRPRICIHMVELRTPVTGRARPVRKKWRGPRENRASVIRGPSPLW